MKQMWLILLKRCTLKIKIIIPSLKQRLLFFKQVCRIAIHLFYLVFLSKAKLSVFTPLCKLTISKTTIAAKRIMKLIELKRRSEWKKPYGLISNMSNNAKRYIYKLNTSCVAKL